MVRGCDAMSKYAEIRSDFVNKEENALYIDAWKTNNPNEEGKILAKIDLDSKEVTYLDKGAKTDDEVKSVINEAVCKLMCESITYEELEQIKYALDYLHDADLCEYGEDEIKTLESVMTKLGIEFVSQL